MKRFLFFPSIFLFAVVGVFGAERDVVAPKIPDRLERVELDGAELGGELDRRVRDLIYKNYMVLDLESNWLDHFRNRTDRGDASNVYFGVGKTIDAGSLFARYAGDDAVERRTQYLLDETIKTQDADGYLGFWNREPNDRQDFVNWIVHEQEYFTLGAVRRYRTTGDPKALEAARRTANHLTRTFPKNERGVYHIPSPISIAGIAEASIELYRVTGEPKYLDFAENLQYEPHWFYEPFAQWRARIERRGFHQYVMLSHLYPETELYRLTGDPARLLKSDWMRRALFEKDYGALLITGSSSNGEQFTRDQRGTGAVGESCVTAYLLRFFDSLLRLEGDLRYGDAMERTIYNALFAAQDPAGRRIRYFTPFSGPRSYFPFDTFCCPGNFRRAVAELPQKVYYRTPDGGVAINLFTKSRKTFDVGGRSVVVRQETDYPNSGRVAIVVETAEPVEFSLTFRTPRWAERTTAQINDEPATTFGPSDRENGGQTIRRVWRNGDALRLDMPMKWRFVEGRIAQAGRVAVLRGPIVYCVGRAQNAELVEKTPNLRDLTLDPTSLGEPEPDVSVRPDGLKVRAKARTPEGETVDVVLTEFPDESGEEVYFRLPADSPIASVADELLDEPSVDPRWDVVSALYGPKTNRPLAELFEPSGTFADLAADYVRPEEDAGATARFSGDAGVWSVWLVEGQDLDAAPDGAKTLLSAANPLYGAPTGSAYGSGDAEGFGFLADWNPAPEPSENWRAHFTERTFEPLVAPERRADFLLTHPVGDARRFLVFRFEPSERLAGRALRMSGTILHRTGGDGVSLEIFGGASGRREKLATVSVASDASARELFQTIPADSGPVDVVLGNNGRYEGDSTALRLRVFATDARQRDVSETVREAIGEGDARIVEFGDYARRFGVPDESSEPKTLKLRLANKIDGAIEYRELADGEPLNR